MIVLSTTKQFIRLVNNYFPNSIVIASASQAEDEGFDFRGWHFRIFNIVSTVFLQNFIKSSLLYINLITIVPPDSGATIESICTVLI